MMENISVNMNNLTQEEKEQLLELVEKSNKNKKDIFNPELNERYFYITSYGVTSKCDKDVALYNKANCCMDRNLMFKRDLVETLSRLLWRFSIQHGWGDEKMSNLNDNEYIYIISFIRGDNKFETIRVLYNTPLVCPYFLTEKDAEQAIDEIVIPFIDKHKGYFEEYIN